MKNNTLVSNNLKYISDSVFEQIKNYTISKDDLYLTIAGTIGAVGIVPPEFDGMNLTENAVKLTNLLMNKDFLMFSIGTSYVQSQFSDKTKQMAQPKLAIERILTTLIAIPPQDEQCRILKSIKAIYPYLERYSITQTALDKLNDGLKDRLHKSILQEAIQGHLVPQDPNDEPVSVLLERIREEKQKLLKEGKIKKKDIMDSVIFKGDDNKYYERIGTEVSEIEVPFQFPESWAIVRLHTICTLADGEQRTGDGICLDAKYLRGKSTGDHLQSGKYVHAGDNIILVDGENSGEVFTVPIHGYMGSTFKRLWVSKNLHLPYVLSCIRFYKDELRNSKKGAAIPHLNKDIFRNLIIGLPPSEEQERIMDKLSDIEGQL